MYFYILFQYPDWLSANNGKLPKEKLDLYAKQFDIVSQLCDLYSQEKTTDSQSVKDARFEKVLDLMTQVNSHFIS